MNKVTQESIYECKEFAQYMEQINHKLMLTPGPGSIVFENALIAKPLFGRGDDEFTDIDNRVMSQLKNMSKHDEVVRLQGAASLALEIATRNFVFGNIIVINTGYYCQRLISYLETIQKTSNKIKNITIVTIQDFLAKEIDELNLGKLKDYDWIVSVYSETSCALKNDIEKLSLLKKYSNAFLFLDSTASIGLEDHHEVADLIAYSSCKGLFGITGACFIAYNNNLALQEEPSFYLNLATHKEKKMTGPYHPLVALDNILPKHHIIKERVVKSKKEFIKRFKNHVILDDRYQPYIATIVKGTFKKNNNHDGRPTIFYTPRVVKDGESVVCHFGELHTPIENVGKIYNMLDLV